MICNVYSYLLKSFSEDQIKTPIIHRLKKSLLHRDYEQFNVYSELLTSEGRIDMLVETEENIFIIEFKCNQSAEKAIQQIKEKNYADKYKLEKKI